MSAPRTLPRLFETSVERFPDNVLMLGEEGRQVRGHDLRPRCGALVHRFAAGLMSLGLEKGDRVALISEGRNDWVIGELGILYCGAVDVPISVKLDELSDLKFRLLHSGCRMAIVSQGQIGKIRQIKNDLPELKLTICFDAPQVLRNRRDLGRHGAQEGRGLPRPQPGRPSRPAGSRSRKAIRPTSATPRARRPIPRASS